MVNYLKILLKILSSIAIIICLAAFVCEIVFYCIPSYNQIYDRNCTASDTIMTPGTCYEFTCIRIESTLTSSTYPYCSNKVYFDTNLERLIDLYGNNSYVGCYITMINEKCWFLTEAKISSAAPVFLTVLTGLLLVIGSPFLIYFIVTG